MLKNNVRTCEEGKKIIHWEMKNKYRYKVINAFYNGFRTSIDIGIIESFHFLYQLGYNREVSLFILATTLASLAA